MICGYAARSGSWIDAFGFVFLQPVSNQMEDTIGIYLPVPAIN